MHPCQFHLRQKHVQQCSYDPICNHSCSPAGRHVFFRIYLPSLPSPSPSISRSSGHLNILFVCSYVFDCNLNLSVRALNDYLEPRNMYMCFRVLRAFLPCFLPPFPSLLVSAFLSLPMCLFRFLLSDLHTPCTHPPPSPVSTFHSNGHGIPRPRSTTYLISLLLYLPQLPPRILKRAIASIIRATPLTLLLFTFRGWPSQSPSLSSHSSLSTVHRLSFQPFTVDTLVACAVIPNETVQLVVPTVRRDPYALYSSTPFRSGESSVKKSLKHIRLNPASPSRLSSLAYNPFT